MSHHIYTTPAMVLSSAPGREADRRYTLFTAEFGMIWAIASGIRRDTSKLRYALQEFSLLDVSLVRGREFWRVTNASTGENIFWRERSRQAVVEMVARIFRLLIRLVPGEEKSAVLYSEMTDALRFVAETDFSDDALLSFEHIVVLRILHDLGYVGTDTELAPILSGQWSGDLLSAAHASRKKIISTINFSLQQSQL